VQGAQRQAIKQAIDFRARKRIAAELELAEEPSLHTCAGCRRIVIRGSGEFTPGCKVCAVRLRARERRRAVG
jgi:hypothetical protein